MSYIVQAFCVNPDLLGAQALNLLTPPLTATALLTVGCTVV